MNELHLIELCENRDLPCQDTVTLTCEERHKARQPLRLDSGGHAILHLPRATVLRGGDVLGNGAGQTVRVHAAPERVSRVHAESARELARAAYHLGNRHVRVEVGPDWLAYLHDRVLDAMLSGLGFATTITEAPFEPEAGAYARHAHGPEGHGHSGDGPGRLHMSDALAGP